jgi:RecA-family ATPase
MIKQDANSILRVRGDDELRRQFDRAKPLIPATPPPKIEIATLPPLTLDEWRDRDLPEPDLLMGHWLTTTTRGLVTAATGLGKTNFGIALGERTAAAINFLHWQAHRPAKVLIIDGEMSRPLLKERVLDEEKRLGVTPQTFFALSREDVEALKPLNTPEGQAWMDAFIDKIGGLDLIIFDNIMSRTAGDPKDPEPWQQTLPWALSLTKRKIGQLWIHHTGHDETRSYGDK